MHRFRAILLMFLTLGLLLNGCALPGQAQPTQAPIIIIASPLPQGNPPTAVPQPTADSQGAAPTQAAAPTQIGVHAITSNARHRDGTGAGTLDAIGRTLVNRRRFQIRTKQGVFRIQ